MNYNQIKVSREERVGVITIDAPPMNGFSKKMIVEVLDCLAIFEKDDGIRAVMMKSTGPNFSQGAGFEDLDKDIVGGVTDTPFSELGGRIVERIDTYPKPTLVAARGIIFGGSSAVFSAFDIRIVGETFNIHDGDIYYGIVGSWGMCSLRLPIWIGRNKVMDYMFLNEGFTGKQAYELGLVSKVVPDVHRRPHRSEVLQRVCPKYHLLPPRGGACKGVRGLEHSLGNRRRQTGTVRLDPW
jgi:enoyl-CoA hydratase